MNANVDIRVPHDLDRLREALGDPVPLTVGTIAGRSSGVVEAYRFPCGCEAVQVAGGQCVLSSTCSVHTATDDEPVRVSDRRIPNVFALRFSYAALGLLTALVAAQQDALGPDGSADLTHPPTDFVGHEESVRELVRARILGPANGGYRLLVFNCWDESTGEWF